MEWAVIVQDQCEQVCTPFKQLLRASLQVSGQVHEARRVLIFITLLDVSVLI